MFTHFRKRLAITIGVAIGSGVATLATIRAKTVNKVDTESAIHLSEPINDKTAKVVTNYEDNSGVIASRAEDIIASCAQRLSQWRQINNIPGLVVGVSLRGHNVWIYSDGFADIENGVKCNAQTVMRIASISKSMTSLLMAKLIQEKRIDLDKPINQYLTRDQFPDKYWEGKKVDITLRQLASHLGGIRHYKKETKNEDKPKDNTGYQLGEFSLPEYYLKDEFPSVMDSLKLFKDDPLLSKPGDKYNYTTFGYTLISAVIESQLNGEKFDKYLTKFLREELGLKSTCLDQNDPIIYNRSHYYIKNEKTGRIQNAPYVDNSYKWAGGGLLSNVEDLLKFGNIMLYSFKGGAPDGKPGLINKDIVDMMWTPAENTLGKFGAGYGLGWHTLRDGKCEYAFCAEPTFPTWMYHTGAAIGALSILMIEPNSELIVAVIVNTTGVSGLGETATYIAHQFTRHNNWTQKLSQILSEVDKSDQ